MAEDTDETRWLSYTELAELRGIDRLSAVRIARRRKWPKQKGNDGTIRVSVPRTVLEAKRHDPRGSPSDSPGDGLGDNPRDIPPDITRKITDLESRVEFLTEQLAELREQRAAAIATAEAERARAERAERENVRRTSEELAKLSSEIARLASSPAPAVLPAPGTRRGLWRRLLGGPRKRTSPRDV